MTLYFVRFPHKTAPDTREAWTDWNWNETECWDLANQTPIPEETSSRMEKTNQKVPFVEKHHSMRGVIWLQSFRLALMVLPSSFSWCFLMVLFILVCFYEKDSSRKSYPLGWKNQIFMGVLPFLAIQNSIENEVFSLCLDLVTSCDASYWGNQD